MITLDTQEYAPIVLYSIFYIFANINLIILGKRKSEEYINLRLVKTIGILNVVIIVVNLLLIPLKYTGSDVLLNIWINEIYQIIRLLIATIPYFITFGLILLKFGITNQERYGSYLEKGGILGIIGYASTNLNVMVYILPSYLSYISGFIGLISIMFLHIFFIVHGIRNRDKYFIISGVLYLTGLLAGFFLGAILFISNPIFGF